MGDEDYILDFSEMSTPASVDLPDERAIQELRRKVESMGRKLNLSLGHQSDLSGPKPPRAPENQALPKSAITGAASVQQVAGQAHEAAHGSDSMEAHGSKEALEEAARLAAASFLSSLQLNEDDNQSISTQIGASQSNAGSQPAPASAPAAVAAAAPKRLPRMPPPAGAPPSASPLKPPQSRVTPSLSGGAAAPSSLKPASVPARKAAVLSPPVQAPKASPAQGPIVGGSHAVRQGSQAAPAASTLVRKATALDPRAALKLDASSSTPNPRPRQPQMQLQAQRPPGTAPLTGNPTGHAVMAAAVAPRLPRRISAGPETDAPTPESDDALLGAG